MAKKAKQPIAPFPEEFAQKVRMAFQNVAEACGSDILQCCIDCEEPPVIDREGLYDYLSVHGGTHGREVQKWVYDCPGDLERTLTAMRVPRTWV